MIAKFLPPRATIALVSVVVALSHGCAYRSEPSRMHLAVIERIDEQEGTHFSPTAGLKPLFRIRLRLAGGSRNRGTDVLDVMLLDLYSAEAYGDVGDTVSFSYPGKLPIAGVVWFEQLNSYRIIVKNLPGRRDRHDEKA